MFYAFTKAIAQLSDPRIRSVVVKSLISSVVVFVLLWAGLAFALTETSLFQWGWLETTVDILGGLAAFVLTIILFPAVMSFVMGFMLEEVASAVEARHYPGHGPARAGSVGETIAISAKFTLVVVLVNLIALPLYLIPVVNVLVFYTVNGYLLSREYLEMVAGRRMEPKAANALRKSLGKRPWIPGMVIAFLLTIPLVNLLAPVVATAAMVHLFEKWRRGTAVVPTA